ncbi:MAG TPA: trypsin-like peptidase domain-containing protein [Clostridia bacterium]
MKKSIKIFSVTLITLLCFGIFASCGLSIDFIKDKNKGIGNFSYNIKDEEPSKYSYSSTAEMLNAVLKGTTEIVLNYQYTTYDFWRRPSKVSGSSSGSGLIVGKTDNGYPIIITNYHVIQYAFLDTKVDYEIYVKLTDKASYYSQQVTILGYDADMDIAILLLEKELSDIDDRVLSWGNSRAVYRGEEVYAIGNALGYGSSLTKGIISISEEILLYDDNDTNDESDDIYKHVIRHDASINSGNSGGVLVNALGEVIGINSYGYLTNDNVAAENMSLAIPSNMARAICDYVLLNYEGQAIDASVAREDFKQVLRVINAAMDEDDNNILVVTEAISTLGLQKNDVLLEVNGIDVNYMFFDTTQIVSPSILLELSYYYTKDEVTSYELILKVKRNGQEKEIHTGYYYTEEFFPVWYKEIPFNYDLAA